eukprot:CAMPEP_0171321452 /NCGR_PEP_ID=MMETSP0816-20121228/112219_1 /TAXON_ID=420281 /ORGANISM="Proboscia inermis, Strain CCAP1064/1" /LENGTH=54 /DNA_ID=CAMNT_0011819453 /DNA_START=46 /DNA_END=206 /DNA_ORIENTATION=+
MTVSRRELLNEGKLSEERRLAREMKGELVDSSATFMEDARDYQARGVRGALEHP